MLWNLAMGTNLDAGSARLMTSMSDARYNI